MEVYILDDLLRRVQVVEQFESLIWADRMTELGDFQMTLFSTAQVKRQLAKGVRLSMNESFKIMTIETIEDKTDDEGRATFTIKGRSFETVLDTRLALASLSDTTTVPKWVLTGTPADIARQIFHDICVTGTIDVGDIVPYIVEGSILPTNLIPEPTDDITYEIEPTTVYNALKTLCDQYFMGFGMFRDYDTGDVYFDIYMGNDRTSRQTDFPAVIFSESLDNLHNTSELSSSALYKNVAYVVSPVGAIMVYGLDVDPSVAGFERRVLLVNATDIDNPDPDVANALMTQRGLQELSKNRMVAAFDGELSQNNSYRPNVDYYVGDLVEVRSSSGSLDIMQVTEQLYVSDEQGEKRYPTFTVYNFITPGTWDARPVADEWDTTDDSEHWDDLE